MTRILSLVALLAGCTTTYDYDPAAAGTQDGTGKALHVKTSSQFVRGIYADLLARAPETYDFELDLNGSAALKFQIDEESTIVNTLDGVGDSQPMRNLVVQGLLHSAEVTIPDKASVADPKSYIHDQFTHLLGREPNAYELASFAQAWMTNPAVGPRAVIRAITGSREYQSH